ncbi:MAG: Maf family protein [Desulfovibrionaceae bacterium]|nr:Maf family protein [Desulfovibrionaceae bacterium]
MASPLFTLKHGISLVLASGSPRRKEFLESWGIPFTCRPVAGEPDPVAGESAAAFVSRCAEYKLAHGQQGPCELVIAADTVVALDDKIMGKPCDENEALSMLMSLSGHVHQVMTATSISFPDKTVASTCSVCHVHMPDWDRETLRAYVATGESMDKAGAYAIQGKGAFLIDRIDGSWSTVVGLPVSWLARELAAKGMLYPAQSSC